MGNCKPEEKEIYKAIKKIKSISFKKKLKKVTNPYYNINTVNKIMNVIINKKIPNNLKKKFHDL